MQHGLIREFAKEHFGPCYYVVPPGKTTTFQPLTLIVKQGKSFRARSRRVVMEPLDKYLVDSQVVQSEIAELKKHNLAKGPEQRVDALAAAGSSSKTEVEVMENLVLSDDKEVKYGKLELGKVQEEFYKDMGLRSILTKARLDRAKIQPYENRKLYLITGVVYSTKLEITGERGRTDAVDASMAFPRLDWLTKIRAKVSIFAKTEPPPALGRRHRSPLLFTYAKVKFDPENSILVLKELVGARLRTQGIAGYEDVVPDSSSQSTEKYFWTRERCAFEDLMESTENSPEVKLEVITTILQQSQSLDDMKMRINKYLNVATIAVSKDGKGASVEVWLSPEDRQLLQSMGIEITRTKLNNSTAVSVPGLHKTKVQDFIKIFHILHDMEEKEWINMKGFIEEDKEHT